jgi:hypothetical protein
MLDIQHDLGAKLSIGSYDYARERKRVLVGEGQLVFARLRDWAQRAIRRTGAFRMQEAISAVEPLDVWLVIACVERLVELGEIVEVRRECFPQYRVFTSPKVNN